MLIEEKFNNEIKLDREKVRKVVPQKFHKWLKVFEKAKSKKIPVRKPWDYIINLRENFVPRKKKTYLILREEKKELREFIEEQLKKEYIRPLKSPQTLPVFFVEKKNRKKRIVINTMDMKRVFTKINLY